MLSALRTGRLYPQEISRYSFLFEDGVDHRAIRSSEGSCQRKIPMTLSEIEPVTFRLVVQCLYQLHLSVLYCTPMPIMKQFPSASFKFPSPMSTHCPQDPGPKHPQSLLFPQPNRPYLATVTVQSDATGNHDCKNGAVGRRST
jgi:hypothetical protein